MTCPDANVILGFVDGRVPEPERAALSEHFDSCEACLGLVAAAARSHWSTTPEQRDAEPAVLAKGTPVGRYLILDVVGRGGMGDVYAAFDPKLGRRVALKLLNARAASPVAVKRFSREAQAIARLSHPNVVGIYDAGEFGERVYLAMEFVEGQTLADWLHARRPSWRDIREVFAAAGAGLAAAHEAGLVHRDFKPQNVMVSRDGSVRVMDFGLATDASRDDADLREPMPASSGVLTDRTLALSRTGALIGTPLYMAPEQFLGRPTDARTDQFSFCVALHEALYGKRPFQADALSTLSEAVVTGRMREPPGKARAPAFLRRLLMRGLQRDPAARFPSMEALLEALRHDPVRRWRSVGIAMAATTLAIAVLVGGKRFATRGERMCRAGGDKLGTIWTATGNGGQREVVYRAFLQTGLPFARQTWDRVSQLLDDYSRRWNEVYTDACEATHVRGDQSAEVLDLRMTCLDTSRESLHALTQVFAQADPAMLVRAIDATHALPSLDRCSDVAALRAPESLPADPRLRAEVAEARKRLAEVKAFADTGQSAVARRLLAPLLAGSPRIGYEPLSAEILSAYAWLEEQSGAPEAAVKVFEKAALSAIAAHRDDIAVEAISGAVACDGYFLDRPVDADRWAELGVSLLRRLGRGHDRVAAWFYQGRAIAHERRAEYGEALADLDRALALKQHVLPKNHPDLALTMHTMANVYNEMGHPQDALVAANNAIEVDAAAYGKDSPLLTMAFGSRGEALLSLGRYEEAERDLRRAVALSADWVGPQHPWTAYPLTALGKALVAEQRSREAVPVLKRALRIRESSEPNPELVAQTRFALARALWPLPDERPAAKKLAIAARDDFRGLPRHENQAAEIEMWLRGRI
jgi:tetratricopeptide (TPR) repeat protein